MGGQACVGMGAEQFWSRKQKSDSHEIHNWLMARNKIGWLDLILLTKHINMLLLDMLIEHCHVSKK